MTKKNQGSSSKIQSKSRRQLHNETIMSARPLVRHNHDLLHLFNPMSQLVVFFLISESRKLECIDSIERNSIVWWTQRKRRGCVGLRGVFDRSRSCEFQCQDTKLFLTY